MLIKHERKTVGVTLDISMIHRHRGRGQDDGPLGCRLQMISLKRVHNHQPQGKGASHAMVSAHN
jgi:hypothetical protein